jgi:HEAT repeat protein
MKKYGGYAVGVAILILLAVSVYMRWRWSHSPVLRLQSKDATTLAVAALECGSVGHDKQKTREVTPALTRALEDEDVWVRYSAAWSLLKLDPENKNAVRAMISIMVADTDHDLRKAAAFEVVHCDKHYDTVVPPLIGLLSDPDPEVQATAAATLGHIAQITRRSRSGRPAIGSANPISQLLNSDSRDVRLQAAQALENLGPDATPLSVIMLGKTLRTDPDKDVRGACAQALREIRAQARGGDLKDEATKALKDSEAATRAGVK